MVRHLSFTANLLVWSSGLHDELALGDIDYILDTNFEAALANIVLDFKSVPRGYHHF